MNAPIAKEAQWRALLVDDERPAHKRLTTLLSAHPEIQIVGEARDLASAREQIHDLQPNLIFLDIQLTPGNGFDLLTDIPASTNVIFVTAHDQFAVRAFETNALDYLLKPVLPKRLANSLDRLRQSPPPVQSQRMTSEDCLILRDGKVWRRIEISTITAILGEGTYSRLLTNDGHSILTIKTLGYWSDTLPQQGFTKLNRSVIINLPKIHKSHFIDRNHAEVWLDGQSQPLTLGRVAVRQLRKYWKAH